MKKSWRFVAQRCECVVVQWLSHVRILVTPCSVACQALCPPLSPRVCPNSCPLSRMLSNHLYSAALFSFGLQSFPASGSFQTSQFFASGGQSIGASASISVLPMNIQDWLPLGLTGRSSLQSKRFSRVFSNTTVQKHQFFGAQPSLWSSSHIRTWLQQRP